MISVQLVPQPILESDPLVDQGRQLVRLTGMACCHFFKKHDLVGDQRPVEGSRRNAHSGQRHIVEQRPSGQDDALIGFCWAHEGAA